MPDSPQQQSTDEANASVLGWTEVDGLCTHTDFKQELVQGVQDYLVRNCRGSLLTSSAALGQLTSLVVTQHQPNEA